MTANPVCRALRMAINNKTPSLELIVHSNRGSQYCNNAYHKIIEQQYFKGSMSAKGNYYDEAIIESFWGILKNDLVYQQDYKTRSNVISDIIGYIGLYYNDERLAKHCFEATQGKSYARTETRIQKGLGCKMPR